MTVVRAHSPGDCRLERVPVPAFSPDGISVRVLGTGVCAGDLKASRGARVWGSAEITPNVEAPVTAGHEFVGQAVALGEGAAEKRCPDAGDHAESEQIVPCWRCAWRPAESSPRRTPTGSNGPAPPPDT